MHMMVGLESMIWFDLFIQKDMMTFGALRSNSMSDRFLKVLQTTQSCICVVVTCTVQYA